MRIVQLVAGAGGMYCGSCLQGNTLASALRAAGHEVGLVPLYTPLRADEDVESSGPIFFGGLNLYLDQRFPAWSRLPRPLRRLLDHPRLVAALARFGGGTNPAHLGPLCVSMLQGISRQQREELEMLNQWLAPQRPEILHLSTLLLAGTGAELARRLRVPAIASLSGEDLFLELLPEPYRSQARSLLRGHIASLPALMAMSQYYADWIAEYLNVPRARIHVVPPGVNLAGYPAPGQRPLRPAPQRIGYFARICPEKGLHLLGDAFSRLAKEPRWSQLELVAGGYLGPADRQYLNDVRKRLAGVASRFRYEGAPDYAGKIALLDSLDVFSMPAVYREGKAIPVLEAWAAGVPVVVPRHGAFPELVERTAGGLLFDPGDASDLAEKLEQLLADPLLGHEMGARGQRYVHEHFGMQSLADRAAAFYRRVLEPTPSSPENA